MIFSNAEIGSAKDNSNSPIHNWYKFSAGFSHRFVEQVITRERLACSADSKVFDPFAGCGTTLVSSQKAGILAIGNESQEFMYDVIRTKLRWKIDNRCFEEHLGLIKMFVKKHFKRFDREKQAHPLLRTLYGPRCLTQLYLIRDAVSEISRHKYRWFFKLALSQTLHKVSIHPIAVPYIVRGTILANKREAWDCFEGISRRMLKDLQSFRDKRQTSKIYLQDSRQQNIGISDGECSICITSPPYLNNLDYGEMSKVHSHFFEYTHDWADITTKVRSKLVTASTTHYSERDFDLQTYTTSEFFASNPSLGKVLLNKSSELTPICRERGGKKSFDILMLLYFSDMFQILKEIRRVVCTNGKAYLVLGDSAPYGIHIPTTKFVARIAKTVGFETYRIHHIRSRGTKWKSLRFRHSKVLSESVLVLK
jgi:DNA modification methylase